MIKESRISLKDNKFYFNNKKHIGDSVCMEDGYYIFFPSDGTSGWDSNSLKSVARILDSLNKEWDEIIQNDPLINNNQGNK